MNTKTMAGYGLLILVVGWILYENGLIQLLVIIGGIMLAMVLLTMKDNFVKKKKSL